MVTVNEVKGVLRRAGIQPGNNRTAQPGYNVFRDEMHGVIVQVIGVESGSADDQTHRQRVPHALRNYRIRPYLSGWTVTK